MVSFGVILVALLTVGLLSRFRAPRPVGGLPDDPGVRAAIAAIGGPLPVATGDLRFESSLGSGRAAGAMRGGPAFLDSLAVAERRLIEARRRLPLEPRVEGLLGHLDLARHRLEGAERHYRAALHRAPHYGEARLGLGVTLALRAPTVGGRHERALTLQGIAQFAAVDEADPCYLPALFDRAVLLARVGRADEARSLARRYAGLDPGSAWNAPLMREVEQPGTR